MELCSVPIRRARAQLIRTVQVGRVHLRAGTPRLELLPVPLAAALYRPSDDGLHPNIVAALSSQAWWIRTYVTTEASERCRVWCAIARSEARRWRS
jgi:hypothetical protein